MQTPTHSGGDLVGALSAKMGRHDLSRAAGAVHERRDAPDDGPIGRDVVEHLAGLTGDSQFWPTGGQVRAVLRELPAYTVFPRSRLSEVHASGL